MFKSLANFIKDKFSRTVIIKDDTSKHYPQLSDYSVRAESNPNYPIPSAQESLPLRPYQRKKFINKIIEIESMGDPKAKSKYGAYEARGLMQLTKPAWDDVNAMRRRLKLPQYAYEKYVEDPIVNPMYGESYLLDILPPYLKTYNIEANISNTIASYNAGIGKFKDDYNFDLKKIPDISKNYIEKMKQYDQD